jgi:NAD(P)-dependent dehydrogenase (short-subunit alcohol dehydrogenase family)
MSNTAKLFDVEDRVAILTGGAGLLGREYTKALVEAGARVVIADKDYAGARNLMLSLRDGFAKRVRAIETEISNKSSVQRMVEQTLTEFGRVDILINNAAIDPKFDPEHGGDHGNTFEDYPLDLWHQSLAVNLTGAFLCAQAVSRPMLAQGRGVIVNISSIYGMVGPDQRLYERSGDSRRQYKPVAYTVTKSAIFGLTRYLATYWAGKNIRVNTLTLGGVFNNHDEEFSHRYDYRTVLGRMACRSEYRGALLFLVSDASSYMTGANLVVDGGWTAW